MTDDELQKQDDRVARGGQLKVNIIKLAHALETFELLKDERGSMEIIFHPMSMQDQKVLCPMLPSVMREAIEELEVEQAALKTEFRDL